MVRYSSGCRTCVKRRVRCDECTPVCNNCLRIGLECGGPRNGAIFIQEEQSTKNARAKKQRLSLVVHAQGESNVSRAAGTKQRPAKLVRHIGRTPCKSDEIIPFFRKYWQAEDKQWTEACLLQPGCNSTAFVAMESLAAAYYGVTRKDLGVINYANLKYVQALEALQSQLNQPNLLQRLDFDILAAGTALSRYEALICVSYNACIQHHAGVSKAIELLGPDAFQEYPNRYILEANFPRIIVHQAYHLHQRSFLQQEGWKRLQINAGRFNSSMIDLLDLFIDLTGIAEDVMSYLGNPFAKHDEVPWILTEIDVFLLALQEWVSSKPLPKLETVAQDDSPGSKSGGNIYFDEEGLLFPTFLQYPSLAVASIMNLWRTIKISALEWRYKLLHPSWWASEDNEEMANIPEIHELAIDICCSLHHHFITPSHEASVGIAEVYGFLFSAYAAYAVFDRHSREAKWVEHLLEDVADRTGVEMSRAIIKGFPDQCKSGI